MAWSKNQPFPIRLGFAWHGLKAGVRLEHSLRFQAGAFALVIVALIALRPAPLWWALLLLASAGVLTAELLNTAIEQLTDHLHPELHPQIRLVKDCAAAAVLVSCAGALAVAVAFIVSLIGPR